MADHPSAPAAWQTADAATKRKNALRAALDRGVPSGTETAARNAYGAGVGKLNAARTALARGEFDAALRLGGEANAEFDRGLRAISAPASVADGQTHVVQRGESLSLIAKRYYGDVMAWPAIYEANRAVVGPDPNRVQPGMRLTIPPTPGRAPAPPAERSGTRPPGKRAALPPPTSPTEPQASIPDAPQAPQAAGEGFPWGKAALATAGVGLAWWWWRRRRRGARGLGPLTLDRAA